RSALCLAPPSDPPAFSLFCERRPPRSPLFPYTTLFRSQPHALHGQLQPRLLLGRSARVGERGVVADQVLGRDDGRFAAAADVARDRKSTRLNSSHVKISYAVFCLKKKIARRRWSSSVTT